MSNPFATKHGTHELKRLIEAAAADLLRLPRPGLWFCVDHIEVSARPPA